MVINQLNFDYSQGILFLGCFFFQKICVAWELSSLQAIPYEYRPLQRIPQEIVDIIPKVSEKEALKIIETLRTKGFLPKLPKFAK